ncbi:MAG: membrane protein insertion efficiency factor YidD [Clostridia bacterium]|nr:membrane protein insertion efficiency factor YidD [Clostridia bacterium]MBR0509734.1 membrane protein insertion efficiency factor YidD [Clostridia bacterium]
MIRDLLLKTISVYQRKISPLFPPRCRYYPTCSQYAYDAIERYGFFFGGILAALRLLRCNPLFPGGVDPVPEFKKIAYRRPRKAATDAGADEKASSGGD